MNKKTRINSFAHIVLKNTTIDRCDRMIECANKKRTNDQRQQGYKWQERRAFFVLPSSSIVEYVSITSSIIMVFVISMRNMQNENIVANVSRVIVLIIKLWLLHQMDWTLLVHLLNGLWIMAHPFIWQATIYYLVPIMGYNIQKLSLGMVWLFQFLV